MTQKQLLNKVFLSLMSFMMLTGCGLASSPEESETASSFEESSLTQASFDSGLLTLRINPEVQIEYNKEGLVTRLDGTNPAGEEIVASYPDYVGKDSREVVQDLVGLIHDAGHLVNESDGTTRNITLELEPGSVMPHEDFLNQLSNTIQETVTELDFSTPNTQADSSSSQTSSAPPKEPENSASTEEAGPNRITLEQAKENALTHAGLSGTEVIYDNMELDEDDGMPYYEIEFHHGGFEYEVEVHAETGNILSYERDGED